jgi:NADPH-dependent 2,4-dienoyl-CoA reductase/sulfur reductase-like enzyme
MGSDGNKRLVVVGGVAAGMSAASQAKRRDPKLEVIVFELGENVSYGACGMPYNIEDPKRKIEDLLVFTPERLRAERGIDVRVNHQVTAIDLQKRVVEVQRPGGQSEFGWDGLVIATGCKPVQPDFEGMDLPGVFELHTLEQARIIKRWLNDRGLNRAVVIGGGHIGLEMTDVLTARGLSVTLLTRSDLLPSGYASEVSEQVRAEISRYGVELRAGARVIGFEGAGRVERVLTSDGPLPADLVLVATGVRPEVDLAQRAGIKLGASGTIAVDAGMRTSAQDVFAAGDCAEAHHRLLDRGMFIPRGTTANKQGKIAGANAVGADERFAGVMGTAVMRIFGLTVGQTGLTDAQAKEIGLDSVSTFIKAKSRAHSYPGAKDIGVRLLAERKTGKLLGAQMVGGEGVAKRLDVLVAALSANMTIDDLAGLDLSYAPPYAPVWDPLLIAANITRKKIG